MTVLEGIQKSTDFLAKKGIDSPRLQAELLLAHVLRLPRMRLYLNFERSLTPAEVDQLREVVRRRGTREPLQQIVGSTSFCGFDIEVTRDVLVPRPETELLAEAGWTFLGSKSDAAALDFGTGSGCLAIALAAKNPSVNVTALDVSSAALAVARRNASRHAVEPRIEFVEGDGLSALGRNLRFDLIISNPPYIPTAEMETLQPEVKDFEPRGALDGGPDGLVYYRRLASEAREFLAADGRLMVELGDHQADAAKKIFQDQNWVVEEIREDYTRRPRVLIARL